MTEQEGFIEAIAQRDSLIKRLANDYANDADTMAAAHKVERDALKDAARLALDARNLVEVKIAELNAERDALELRIGAMIVERSDAFFKVIQERDAYAAAADTMAAAHKVERDALKSENGSLRELMNTYNIGGWTDSLSLIEERGSLKKAARFALDALEYHTAQTRPIERTQIAIEILKAVL